MESPQIMLLVRLKRASGGVRFQNRSYTRETKKKNEKEEKEPILPSLPSLPRCPAAAGLRGFVIRGNGESEGVLDLLSLFI